jgi:hypothetical protein
MADRKVAIEFLTQLNDLIPHKREACFDGSLLAGLTGFSSKGST